MRLFIAIELPDDLKRALGAVQEQLKARGLSAAWTRAEGIHLTLKFLGDVPEPRIPGIVHALELAARDAGTMQFAVEGGGAFPDLAAPRVVWLGINGDLERLAALQKRVEDELEHIGFERDTRAWSPHLTLARIKYLRRGDNWRAALDGIRSVRHGEFAAERLSLMKSELQRSGAVYTELAGIRLDT